MEPPARRRLLIERSMLADCCVELGLFDEAAETMEGFLALKPGDAFVHGAVAELYEKAGRPADAARHRELARRAGPESRTAGR